MATLIKFNAKMDYSSTDSKKEPSDWPAGEPESVRKAERKGRN
jgi:hypothetical protein